MLRALRTIPRHSVGSFPLQTVTQKPFRNLHIESSTSQVVPLPLLNRRKHAARGSNTPSPRFVELKSTPPKSPYSHLTRHEDASAALIGNFTRYMRTPVVTKRLEMFIHLHLDKCLPFTPTPHQLFEDATTFLINKVEPQVAATVFERMLKKGYIPTKAAESQMAAVLLALLPEDSPPLFEMLVSIVVDPEYTEDNFVGLLKTMYRYDVHEDIVALLSEQFVTSRGPTYQPDPKVWVAIVAGSVRVGETETISSKPGGMRGRAKRGRPQIRSGGSVVISMGEEETNTLVPQLQDVVSHPSYSDRDLFQLLETMSAFDVDDTVASLMLETFLASRGADYCPTPELLKSAVQLSALSGNLERAFQMVEQDAKRLHSSSLQQRRRHQQESTNAHLALLAILRDAYLTDTASVNRLLALMNESGTPANIATFNILLSRAVRLGKVPMAVRMYNGLKTKTRDVGMLPDAYTFATMFAAYRGRRVRSLRLKLSRLPTKSKTKRSSPTSSSTQSPIDVIAPRRLFKDLSNAIRCPTASIRPQTALFNTALRTYLRHRDYSAAFTVLRAFTFHGVPLDQRTYYSLVRLLLRRVWAETLGDRPRETTTWADRFLGVDHPWKVVLGEELVRGVVARVCKKEFDVAAPMYVYRPRGKGSRGTVAEEGTEEDVAYRFPTMRMMESVNTPEPVDFVYEWVPLSRLMKRAIWAGLDPGKSPEQKARLVEEEIAKAEAEML